MEDLLKRLSERRMPDGGFAPLRAGRYRPDATAWAALVLRTYGQHHDWLESARGKLRDSQSSDGRVSISSDHPDGYWPTPLAIFAWHGWSTGQELQQRAVEFLLQNTGVHGPKPPGDVIGHDTAIRGWPWIANTHSWVEPTALSLLALRITGQEKHARAQEATRLLMNRQLPHGGWNYGNTTVMGQELRPFPESTGLALCALIRLVPQHDVSKSLDYLRGETHRLRTPMALGWGLLGLASWGHVPDEGSHWVEECLFRQKRYGSYDTSSLSLLFIARKAVSGLLDTLLTDTTGSANRQVS